MKSLKDLVRVSFMEFPDTYWESFEELKNLYVNDVPVLVGYHGNLYKVSITEHGMPWDKDPSYMISPRYRVSIWDLTNKRLAGEGDFDLAYCVGPMTYTMTKVKSEVKKAIVKMNMKSTDYYE